MQAHHVAVATLLSSVTEEMKRRKNIKYTYAEVKFFSMWWDRQTEDVKKDFKEFLKEGRWEFTNGGWSASDEACPTYTDMILN